MNRTVLIMVVLFSIIFASISLNLMNRSSDLTETMGKKASGQNVGNLGAYALNWAIKQINDGNVSESETKTFNTPTTESFEVLGGYIDQVAFDYEYENSEYSNPIRIVANVSWYNNDVQMFHTSEAIVNKPIDFPYDMLAHYRFNQESWDQSGEVWDVVEDVKALNATSYGVDNYQQVEHFPTEYVADFDGTTDYIETPEGFSSLMHKDQTTVGFWMKTETNRSGDIDWGILASELNFSEQEEVVPNRWNRNRYPHYRNGYHYGHYRWHHRHQHRKYFAPVWGIRTHSFQGGWIFKLQHLRISFYVVTEDGLKYISFQKSSNIFHQQEVFKWYYVAASYDKIEKKIYLRIGDKDGNILFSNSKTLSTDIVGEDADNTVFIGGRESVGPENSNRGRHLHSNRMACFKGKMAGFGIFNQVLSDADVSSICNSYRTTGNILNPDNNSSDGELKIVYWQE